MGALSKSLSISSSGIINRNLPKQIMDKSSAGDAPLHPSNLVVIAPSNPGGRRQCRFRNVISEDISWGFFFIYRLLPKE
ncbi:hypothetical protein CDAR_93331 [Caerostris darwini]|uniref:Uncharacterized protein n=1 Tax=Caerostris darwini TaxID=1538125 RepID=A0AAV4QHB2_9ARAC|nr:hypothetical protein CDAR_93331 [Caerostris darwini]